MLYLDDTGVPEKNQFEKELLFHNSSSDRQKTRLRRLF